MEKIEKLTDEQKSKMEAYVRMFTNIGLATHTEWNKTEIEKWMAGVYAVGGLEKPKIFIYLGSPFAGAIGAHMLTNMHSFFGPRKDKEVRAQVWAQVRAQVRAQVWDQVRDQVWAQVGDQVGAQVWDQVGDQVGDQVRAQVRAQVWAQVGDQVRAQVWDQVRDQVRAQVGDQVWAQVGDQVGAQVGDQVGDQVRAQVRAQVGDQVRAQVRAQVWAQVWDQVGAQVGDQVHRSCFGSHDANWLAFFSFFLNECSLKACERLIPLTELTKHVGWFWPFQNAVIVTPRPSTIHRNARGRLHNTDGPALTYLDGFSIYAMNGVRFTGDMEKFVKIPTNGLIPAEILDIKNVEQRAEVIKKYGIAKLFRSLNPKKLDTWNGYELYEIRLYSDVPRIYIKMQNPSVDEIHIEAVDPNCRTVAHALSWRNDGVIKEQFIAPAQLT